MVKANYIPWLLFGSVALFILFDCIFIGIAYSTFTGAYTDNYYQKGVDFDKINRQSIYHDKAGWNSEIIYDARAGRLTFKLYNPHRQPLSGATVVAKIMRPVTKSSDNLLMLKETKPGEYSREMNFPVNGQWEVRIKASVASQEYITSRRFLIDYVGEK